MNLDFDQVQIDDAEENAEEVDEHAAKRNQRRDPPTKPRQVAGRKEGHFATVGNGSAMNDDDDDDKLMQQG